MAGTIQIYDESIYYPLIQHAVVTRDTAADAVAEKLWGQRGVTDTTATPSDAYMTTYTADTMPPNKPGLRIKCNAGQAGLMWKSQRSSPTIYYESWRQRFIREGHGLEADWPLGHYNRARGFMKFTDSQFLESDGVTPREMGRLNNKERTPDIQLGTYVAFPLEVSGTSGQEDWTEYFDSARGSNFEGHGYHGMEMPPEPVWHQYIVDPKPLHNRNAQSESPYHHRPFKDTYPDYGYFDVIRDFYIKYGLGQEPVEGKPYWNLLHSGFELFKDDESGTGAIADEQNLVDAISTLSGCYLPERGQFFLNYCAKHSAFTTEVRYSFNTTYGQSFDGLTPVPGNPERSQPDSVYEGNAFYETINFGANPYVYFAFRVKENPEWGHREICIPVDPQVHPPLPGGVAP